MDAKQLSQIGFGSPELEQLRLGALRKDKDKAKDYLYWCAWHEICNAREIPSKQKFAAFQGFMNQIPIEVHFDG